MSDVIGDLLPKGRYEEPPEVRLIKDYVLSKYKITPKVTVQPNQIIISVPSAALAGTLRFQTAQIQEECNLTQRLLIRIG